MGPDPAALVPPLSAVAAIRSPGAVALIGAVAGVVGGIGGALAGGWATYRIEHQRQTFERRRDLRAEQREREREASVTRGVARVWATRLDDFRYLVESHGPDSDPAMWWPDEYNEDFSIPIDDMQRVAGAATSGQWEAIDFALSAVRTTISARAISGVVPMDDSDRELVAENMEVIDRGITALDEIARALPRLSIRGT